MSENVAQCGTEGRFAVLSSELEEACPSFEATTVPASSNAVRAAHRICTDTESSTEVVEPIPVQNNGGDVNHRHQRRRFPTIGWTSLSVIVIVIDVLQI